MRRLVVASAIFILVGLSLLLTVVPLWGLLTGGSGPAPSGSGVRFVSGSSATSGTDTTIESLVGFGMVGLGLVMEVFSLFTDVGTSQGAVAQVEKGEGKA